jgi:RIO kinase 1
VPSFSADPLRSTNRPSRRNGKRRFDDDEPYDQKFISSLVEFDEVDDGPDDGDRWSSYSLAGTTRGPEPLPDWVITDLGAVDQELGVLKTGKEADVHLVERSVPGTDRSVLLAAKRYRRPEHRQFHRDAGYLDGRRVRESRLNRAMAGRTAFGREVIAGQWAMAEFGALAQLWELGVSVPYPVQLLGTELMIEYFGEPDGRAAPRLAQTRPEPDLLASLWDQLVDAMSVLARSGLAHGDLSPFNLLVHGERLVMIDLPQIVDVVSNPAGVEFLTRDASVVAKWFAARGLDVDRDKLIADLLSDAGIR